MSPPNSCYPRIILNSTYEQIITDKRKNIFHAYFFKQIIELVRKKEFKLRLVMHYLEPNKFLKPINLEIRTGGETKITFERKKDMQVWCPTYTLPSLKELYKKLNQSNLSNTSKGTIYIILKECELLEKQIEKLDNPQIEFGNPTVSLGY